MRYKRFIFPLLLCLIFLIPLTSPVFASEVEEVDEFNQIPTYRWDQNDWADDTPAEELIDNGYEVYTNNSNYERYRELNTRDFEIQSRFKADGANDSYLEFFTDTQADRCDFYEDYEGWAGSYGYDTITNGDFETDTAARIYYDEAEENTLTGWDYESGFPVADIGWLDLNNSNQYMYINGSTALILHSFDTPSHTLEIDEDKKYKITASMRTNWISGASTLTYSSIFYQFYDSGDVLVGDASFYINKGWNGVNDSDTVRYFLDDTDEGEDSGWFNIDLDLMDVFNEIPDLDSAGERADIASVKATCFGYTSGLTVNIGWYFDDVQISSSEELLGSDSTINFETIIEYPISANYSTYDLLEFRARASSPSTLNWTLDADIDASNYTAITSTWTDYAIVVAYNMSNQLTDVVWYCENMNTSTIYIDWIYLWGDMDWNNTIGEYTAGEDLIPEVPGYWTNTTAAPDHEFTINGDFEDDAAERYYYDGEEKNGGITGWDLQAGFDDNHDPFDSNIGSIETGAPDGSQMFQHSKPDSGDQDNKLYSEGDVDQWLDFTWVEGVTYMYNISIRYDDLPDDDDKDCYNQFTIDFRDDADMWIMFQIELNNYATGRTNTTTGADFGRLYWVTTIAKEGDTGWLHYSFNMTELFELMEASDTQAERESLTKFYVQYRNTGADGTEEGLIQCDNWLLYNMTADSNVWTPAVPEVPAVPGYWNYTYSTPDFTQWDEGGFRFTLAEEYYPFNRYSQVGYVSKWETASIEIRNYGHSFEESTYQLQVIFYGKPSELIEDGSSHIIYYWDEVQGGVFWNYTTTFEHNPREWFRLDWDFDLEEREMNLKLTEDDGTSIINLDLFDIAPTITELPYIFNSFKNPWVGLNFSSSTEGHTYASIDYIDAPWVIHAWDEPNTIDDWIFGASVPQNPDHFFDTVSPYTMQAEDIPTGAFYPNSHIYTLNVDHFDALSFDYNITAIDGDLVDSIRLYVGIYNVRQNGTLDEIIWMRFNKAVSTSGQYRLYHGTDLLLSRTSFGTSMAGSFNFYVEDSQNSILQVSAMATEDSSAYRDTIVLDYTNLEDNSSFTNEWVFAFGWWFEDVDGDSTFKGRLGGFDLVRKDILKQAIGLVLDPILNFFAIILTPLFLVFNFVGWLISSSLEGLGDIFGTVIAEVLTFFDPLFDWLQDILDEFAALVDPIVAASLLIVEDFIEAVIDAFVALASALVEGAATVIFYIWDDIIFDGATPPDLIALFAMLLDGLSAFIGGVIQVLEWVLEMMEFLGTGFWIIWLLVWAYVVLLTALQTSGGSAAVQWIEGMSEKAMKNVSPGSISIPIPFVGSIPIVPSNIPLLIPLIIGTAIELGTWDALIAWVAP